MRSSDTNSQFDRVDWSDVTSKRRLLTPERVTLCSGFFGVLILFLYERLFVHVYIVGTYQMHTVDWVFLLGLVVLTAYVGVPAIRHQHNTKRIVTYLYDHPAYAAAAMFLVLVLGVGVVGPVIMGEPRLRFQHRFHAPYGLTAEMGWTNECLGAVTQGEGITRYCEGTLTYPLGTNHRGHALGHLLVIGARVALYVLVFTAAFVVPLAAATGIVAGLRGGVVDDFLMSYVDVQLCIPAIIVYFIGYIYWNPSLMLLLATFGLLSWGGIARLVRSEVLQRREDGYVLVARSLGASQPYVARRHIVPNITNTLVPAVFHLLALLVLVEAGVAFLGFHDLTFYSWGSTIQEGLDPDFAGIGLQMEPHEVWWISTFPMIALTLTLASLKLVGDGIRDALDPRRYH